MNTPNVVINLLGLGEATAEYRLLAVTLVRKLETQDSVVIWAFEIDRPILDATFTSKISVQYFSRTSDLMGTLQQLQSNQPVVLNPMGLSPIKTFALPTISFVLPLDKVNLWAPFQIFGGGSGWEKFSELLLSSHLIIHCSSEPAIKHAFNFKGLQEFAHEMELIQKDNIFELSQPLAAISESKWLEWFALTKTVSHKYSDLSALSNTPLVSIITPSFNQAHFIESTIGSVLKQNYSNFEYIIVDGKSSDATVSLLKRYDGKIKWLSEADRGYADAVRKGFAMAQGKYLCWLPSDDEFFDATSLTTLVANIEATNSDVVYGNCIYVDEESRWLDQYKTSSFDISKLKNWCLIPQPSTLIRASSYRTVEGINADLLSVADYDLWLRMSEIGAKFLRIGAPISKYRLHSKSITTSKTASTYAEIIRLQIRRYGLAFPGWIRGAVGEVIHHIKGRPHAFGIGNLPSPNRGKLRILLRSGIVESLIIRIPLFQKFLATVLHKIDG